MLEQYPEEKHSELRLPGNRLWMVVKNLGQSARPTQAVKERPGGVRESLGTVSFKEGLSVFLSIFLKLLLMLSQRLHKKDMFIAEKKEDLFLYQIFIW